MTSCLATKRSVWLFSVFHLSLGVQQCMCRGFDASAFSWVPGLGEWLACHFLTKSSNVCPVLAIGCHAWLAILSGLLRIVVGSTQLVSPSFLPMNLCLLIKWRTRVVLGHSPSGVLAQCSSGRQISPLGRSWFGSCYQLLCLLEDGGTGSQLPNGFFLGWFGYWTSSLGESHAIGLFSYLDLGILSNRLGWHDLWLPWRGSSFLRGDVASFLRLWLLQAVLFHRCRNSIQLEWRMLSSMRLVAH